MKHLLDFDDFLNKHVNLNPTRLEALKKRVKTITDILKEKLANYRKYSEQGSYAHKTIIKPVQANDQFDADILTLIRDNNFDPNKFETDYVKTVYDVFKNNDNYKDKIEIGTRCVTIDYAGDFDLDIVPCVEHNGTNYICNRTEEKYEKTDGDGYKTWLINKNQIVRNNNFRKTTRLLKFLRDHKDNFSVKSILLTTLLGNEVKDGDGNSRDFSDVPTTLKTLSNRLNDFLQMHITMPIIENPVMSEEDFNRHWNQKKYDNFRDKFSIYNKRIDEAFEEKDHDESIKKWRKLFGDDFGKLTKKSSNTSSSIGVAPAVVIPTTHAKKPFAID